MSLESGEDTRLNMSFSDELSYDEFGQNARFTYMYNGVLHSNVSAVKRGDTWRIDGEEETIIDVVIWEGSHRSGTTSLIIGRHDWKLIAITYGEDYQLKPQDLIGLAPGNNPASVANPLLSGETVPFVLNENLYSVSYDSAESKAHFKVCACNPSQTDKAANFATSPQVITSYSCETFNALARADDITDFLTGTIGLQPQQVTEAIFEGYLSSTPVPVGIYEL